MTKRTLQAHLEVETHAGAVLGGARIRLLEAVDKFGSISKAARRIPMSYKAAWDALDDLNNLADFPVVERNIGGVGGGGTKLTDYGRKLIAMFRAVEDEYQTAMDHLHGEASGPAIQDKAAFQRLLRRITLRTSARNQFSCAVARIQARPVSAQVFLALDDDCELEAQITSDSVKHLALSPGREVIALVKAPAVFLLSDPDNPDERQQPPHRHRKPHPRGSGECRGCSGPATDPNAPHHIRRHDAGRNISGTKGRVCSNGRLSGDERDPNDVWLERTFAATSVLSGLGSN